MPSLENPTLLVCICFLSNDFVPSTTRVSEWEGGASSYLAWLLLWQGCLLAYLLHKHQIDLTLSTSRWKSVSWCHLCSCTFSRFLACLNCCVMNPTHVCSHSVSPFCVMSNLCVVGVCKIPFFWLVLLKSTLCTLTSVYTFSILFSIHFLMCWEGEFVEQSRASLVEDLYPDPFDLSIWFMGDIVRRN